MYLLVEQEQEQVQDLVLDSDQEELDLARVEQGQDSSLVEELDLEQEEQVLV